MFAVATLDAVQLGTQVLEYVRLGMTSPDGYLLGAIMLIPSPPG